ncbi:hypothetical protein [Helicobacter sp.]|uniref:hypothetical protein n=1 Tax=Helicobacter sp. TaxID=218 RepID=UPI0025BFA0DA|nr:hypothetical protein [Helicobacter sp.]MCI5632709.1 hypothetical protein [Helicobacter sp.]
MQVYGFALKRVRSFAQRTPRFHKWNLAMTIGYKIMDCHDFLRSLAMTKCNPSVIAHPLTSVIASVAKQSITLSFFKDSIAGF